MTFFGIWCLVFFASIDELHNQYDIDVVQEVSHIALLLLISDSQFK